MIDNLSNIISFASLIIAVISIVLSIKAFYFSKKTRENDNRPLLEYSNSFGGYINTNERILNIHLELKNTGSKAIILKIEDLFSNGILCSQINTSINNNAMVEILINAKQRIKHEELNYNFNIYLKNIDNKIYMQTIIGHGIYPKISPSKKINKIKKAGNKG